MCISQAFIDICQLFGSLIRIITRCLSCQSHSIKLLWINNYIFVTDWYFGTRLLAMCPGGSIVTCAQAEHILTTYHIIVQISVSHKVFGVAWTENALHAGFLLIFLILYFQFWNWCWLWYFATTYKNLSHLLFAFLYVTFWVSGSHLPQKLFRFFQFTSSFF